MVSRRGVLEGIGAGFTAALAVGLLREQRSEHCSPVESDYDIGLFYSEEIDKNEAEEASRLVDEALEMHDLDVRVSGQRDPKEWRESAEGFELPEDPGRYSSLMIHSGEPEDGNLGRAQSGHGSCSDDPEASSTNMSMVENFSVEDVYEALENETVEAYTHDGGLYSPLSDYDAWNSGVGLLHEIGHNLGLDHDYSIEFDGEEVVKVPIMRAGYESGQVNYLMKKEGLDEVDVEYRTRFTGEELQEINNNLH